ncbi:MAG: signal peptidase I [Streptosporangiales bacterium]
MNDDKDTSTRRHEPAGKHRSPRRSRGKRDEQPDPAEKEPERTEPARGKVASFFRELVILVVLVIVLTALLRGFVFGAYRIPSGSMEQTLMIGDKVLVNKLVYHFRGIERGDVIVFNGAGSWTPKMKSDKDLGTVQEVRRWVVEFFGGTPVGEEDFIKRVVGVPGDKIACRRTDQGFRMFVNGTRLKERSYLYPGDAPCAKRFAGREAITVPKGRLWVMGDHRSLSADSRAHLGDGHLGTIPEDKVIGRAFVIVWPVDRWSTLSQPDTYHQRALEGALPLPGSGGSAPPVQLAGALLLTAGGALRRRRSMET